MSVMPMSMMSVMPVMGAMMAMPPGTVIPVRTGAVIDRSVVIGIRGWDREKRRWRNTHNNGRAMVTC
jgi:hypothetical protein